MKISNFIKDALIRTYCDDGHFPFCKMDSDGTIEGTVDIERNVSGIMNIAIIINYNGNICDWKDEGKITKRFRTIDEAELFIREFNEALDSTSIIRFTERFFDIDFSGIYTPFEELLL